MSNSGAYADTAEQPRNCLGCKQRKVRCDRRQPCSTCTEHNRQCIFPVSGRALRRPEPKPGTKRRKVVERAQLIERIRRLENVVDELVMEVDPNKPKPSEENQGGLVDSSVSDRAAKKLDPDGKILSFKMTTTQRSIREASSHVQGQFSKPLPQTNDQGMILPEDQGRVYVGDYFWATLQWEVRLIRERLEGIEAEDSEEERELADVQLPDITHLINPPENRRRLSSTFTPMASSFLLRSPRGRLSTSENLRPLPSQTQFIWQIYVDNVDPFVKILHVPTMTKAIQEAMGNFANIDLHMEVLMFSISLAAIRSLSDDDASINFNVPKEDLVQRFQVGTEEALSRAEFTNTTSLMVLQAITIYLYATRPFQTTRHTWCLTGLLVRLAISLGLHRDGSAFTSMSPFEVEIRRRVWWHVCFLDFSAGDRQVSEMSVHEALFDTQGPLNINDTDIWPEMTEPPQPRVGYTDISLTIIQKATWRQGKAVKEAISKLSADRENHDWSTLKRSTLLHEFEKRITDEFFSQGFQPDILLRQMCLRLLSVATRRYELFLSSAPRPILSPPGTSLREDEPYQRALNILEDVYALKTDLSYKRWTWKLSGFVEWQALAVVLSRLYVTQWTSSAEEGWRGLTRYMTTLADIIRQEPLWKPISRLLEGAQRNRLHQLNKEAETGSPESRPQKPELIGSQTSHSLHTATSDLYRTANADLPVDLDPSSVSSGFQDQAYANASPGIGEVNMSAELAYPIELLNWDGFHELL